MVGIGIPTLPLSLTLGELVVFGWGAPLVLIAVVLLTG
jgi:hypothetical protein